MNPTVVFDLSEVLIYGLVGVEKNLAASLNMPETEILKCFGGERLQKICRGEITEDVYLQEILALQKWDLPSEMLKRSIRDNFHLEVEGTRAILLHLAKKHDVFLLSDHAREWVAYIKSIHPFLDEFKRTFFSYELETTKKDPQTFEKLLQELSCEANECWLIDDSLENVKAAVSIGINAIRFTNADQLREELIEQSLW